MGYRFYNLDFAFEIPDRSRGQVLDLLSLIGILPLGFWFLVFGFSLIRQGYLTLDFVSNYLILENPFGRPFCNILRDIYEDVQMENTVGQ